LTKYIIHRQNQKKDLLKINNLDSKGIEIDLRTDSKKIIVTHDPFTKGFDFIKNVKLFKNYFLIIDIKASGFAKIIAKILKKNKIKFLLLNLNAQEFVQMINLGFSKNLFIRFSSYENFNLNNKILKKIDWVWIDFFNNMSIKIDQYKYIKKNKKKICITSPDLLGKGSKAIINLILHLNKNKIKIDMVCTKKNNIKFWKKHYIF
tara:strand:+ start:136 stop:750 length:615 start_codon:yes stop_codon:yes gene_type:complete